MRSSCTRTRSLTPWRGCTLIDCRTEAGQGRGSTRRAYPGGIVERQRFEELVSEALEKLPDRFAERLLNIDLEVLDWPTAGELQAARVPAGGLLLGLYRGVPQTRRGQGYSMTLPDRIFIYQGPI